METYIRDDKGRWWIEGKIFGDISKAKSRPWITQAEFAQKIGLDHSNLVKSEDMIKILQLEISGLQGKLFVRINEDELRKARGYGK